jgi:hypothetical protein
MTSFWPGPPEDEGLDGAAQLEPETSHLVAACVLALAAWKWAVGQPMWMTPADPPLHPYNFVC